MRMPQWDETEADRLEREETIRSYVLKQGLNYSEPEPEFFDFDRGKRMEMQPDGSPYGSSKGHVATWKKFKDRFKKYIDLGFDLFSPIPHELYENTANILLPDKSMWPQLMQLRDGCDGMNDPLYQPLVYTLKFCSGSPIDPYLEGFTYEGPDMRSVPWRPTVTFSSVREIIDTAERRLQNDIMLNTNVRQIIHTPTHVDVHIFNEDQGGTQIIRAKNLVIAEQPSGTITRYIRSNEVLEDYKVFEKFRRTNIYTAVVKDNVFHPMKTLYHADSLRKYALYMSGLSGISLLGKSQIRNLRSVTMISLDTQNIDKGNSIMLHTLQKLANFTKPDIVERESPDFEIMAIT